MDIYIYVNIYILSFYTEGGQNPSASPLCWMIGEDFYTWSSARRELPMKTSQQNHSRPNPSFQCTTYPNPTDFWQKLLRKKCLRLFEMPFYKTLLKEPFQTQRHVCQAAPLLFSPKQLPYFPRRHQGDFNAPNAPDFNHSNIG